MGTITIAVNKDQLISDPSHDLKHSLLEVNPSLSKKGIKNNKLNKSKYPNSKTGYMKHIYGYIDNKYISILSIPKPFFNYLPDFKITWHQSQWKSQEEVAVTFIKIFGIENAETILCKGQILRIDFWIDTELSYDKLRQTIYRPKITVSEPMKSKKRSYYLGAKGPIQAVFYEKPFKDRNQLDIKGRIEREIPTITRIEIRYFGKKVPISTYANYIDTAKIDVFDSLQTYFFNKNKLFEQYQHISKQRLQKLEDFIDLVEKEGLQYARTISNTNRNFYRTIEPILKKVSRNLNLSEHWRRKVKFKIVGKFKINEFFKTHISH